MQSLQKEYGTAGGSMSPLQAHRRDDGSREFNASNTLIQPARASSVMHSNGAHGAPTKVQTKKRLGPDYSER